MDHKIALNFEDGVTRFVVCPPSETVADASYRAGINIPLDCRDGACGTCKAFCESGSFQSGSYIEDALTDEEARNGFCLPCQMKPTSDLVVRIAAASSACKVRPVSHRATVVVDQFRADPLQRLADGVEDRLVAVRPRRGAHVSRSPSWMVGRSAMASWRCFAHTASRRLRNGESALIRASNGSNEPLR